MKKMFLPASDHRIVPCAGFLSRCLHGVAVFILVLSMGQAATAGELKQAIVKAVTASSDGTENPIDWPHHPAMAIDGNLKTCWASGTNDTVGAWLKFSFDAKTKIDRIQIVNGWIPQGYPDFYTKNHRAQTITLTYDNGKEETFELKDENAVQTISPALAGETKSVTLKIDKLYAATTGDEPWVTLSEVTFFSVE